MNIASKIGRDIIKKDYGAISTIEKYEESEYYPVKLTSVLRIQAIL